MDLLCLLYYAVACLGGGLLSWLMFSNGSHTKQLKLQADKDRNTLNELLTEFNTHRTDSKAKIYTKDAEIALLKKKLKERKDLSSANGSETELIKWKSKVRALEQQIHTNKTVAKSTASEESERKLKTLQERNKSLQEKIAELTQRLEDLKSSQSAQPEGSPKALELKDQEIASLQRKLKKAKKKAKKQKNLPAQKWQVEELLDLIKKGKLK